MLNRSDKPLLFIGEDKAFEFQGRKNDLTLFAILGNALAAIQAFEFSILTHLCLLSNDGTPEPSDAFYSMTLGKLINEFKKQLPDTGIAERLEEARKGRNYLVHHILRKYEWPMMSDEDYIDAVKEIDKIRDLIETVNVEVAQYLSDRSLLNIIVLSINHDSGDIQRVV